MSSTATASGRRTAWIEDMDCTLETFRAQLPGDTDLTDYPHAVDVRDNVPVYAASDLDRADRRALQAELSAALADGPGVVVFAGAFSQSVTDAASAALT